MARRDESLTPRRALARLLLFAAGFVAVAWCVRRLAPEVDATLPTRKLELLRDAQPEAWDVVFVGSSRVQRNVDPQRFDRALAERGHALRSFNLGAPLMLSLEQEALLERLFAGGGARPRLVLIDPETVERGSAEHLVGSARFVAWHGPAACLRAGEALLEADLPTGALLRALAAHARAGFRRATTLGDLRHRLLADVERVPPPYRWQELAAEGRGFMSLEAALASAEGAYREGLAARRRAFLSEPEAWAREVERLRGAVAVAPESGERGADARAVLRLDALVRRHGATPVFFITPGAGSDARNDLRRLHRDGAIEHLLDFGDPARHPELWVFERWFDDRHLTDEGVERFTVRLAEAVAGLLERSSG